MTRRTPPEGQRCECTHHLAGEPSKNLRRVFWERGGRMCYSWWCQSCYQEDGIEDMEDGWPRDDAGRFMPSVYCQEIPGLD